MIELFMALHPVVQVIAIAVGIPLLLIFATLTILLAFTLIDAIVVNIVNCHANHCRTKIAVAAAKKERA